MANVVTFWWRDWNNRTRLCTKVFWFIGILIGLFWIIIRAGAPPSIDNIHEPSWYKECMYSDDNMRKIYPNHTDRANVCLDKYGL